MSPLYEVADITDHCGSPPVQPDLAMNADALLPLIQDPPVVVTVAPNRILAETSSILKLKGLPYSATEEQVREFFQNIVVKGVHFVFEPDGRPSGLAFAEFESKDDAMKALSLKNGEFLGERYVRLLHVPVTEMEEQVRMGTLAVPGNAAKMRARLMRQQQQQRLVYMGSPMVSSTIPTAMAPHGAHGMPHGRPVGPVVFHPPQFMNLPWQSFPMPQHPQTSMMPLALQFQNLSMGASHSYPGVLPHRGPDMHQQHHHQLLQQQQQPTAMMMPPQQQQQQQAAPTGHMYNSAAVAASGMPMQQAQMVPQAGINSTTAKVRGLPYRSSPAEILGFFRGYQYLPDSLQIGLDSLGRPSGEAWLSFLHSEEALRAVRDLNRQFLGSRYLELSIC